jgi:peptidoglycan/LPS O-acetylase OafA/YrhL
MAAFKYIPLFGRHYRKSNNLDFIRFCLAVLVIYCHCFVIYFGTEETVEPLWVFSQGQMSLGTLAVNFFFILSGFLIYQSWENSTGVFDYLKKRILRIYPGYIVVSILCIFVIGPFGTADYFRPIGYWPEYYGRIQYLPSIINILTLGEVTVPWSFNDIPMANVINGSLWTIRYEFLCYLLVAIFGLAKLFRFRWFAPLIFCIGLFFYALQEFYHVWIYNWEFLGYFGKPDFYPRFLVYFFSGVIYYQNKHLVPRIRSLFLISIFICLLSTYYFEGLMFTLPIFGAYAIFYIAFSLHFRMYKWARFGDFSYGIYLYAWPVQQLLVLYFEPYMNILNLFTLATLGSIVLAFLSWNLIEKPALKWKSKTIAKKIHRPAFSGATSELMTENQKTKVHIT